MKLGTLLLSLIALAVLSGCYGPLTGTVVDAQTKAPIEGAVVYVEWPITKGMPGLSYGDVYKIVETETDKDGKFYVPGVYNPFVSSPELIIYKYGYVAWKNNAIFAFPDEDFRKRSGFRWGSGQTLSLEKFKTSYSHAMHLNFIQGNLILSSSSKLQQAISSEWQMERKELDMYRNKFETKKYSDTQTMYKEIVKELYLHEN